MKVNNMIIFYCSSKHHVALNARVDPGLEGGGGWHSARALSLLPMSRRYELQSQCHVWAELDGFLVCSVKYLPR